MKKPGLVTIIGSLIALSQCVAHAQTIGFSDGNGTHGGDDCERRFKSVGDDISSWITKGGARSLKLPGQLAYETYELKMQNYILGSVSERTTKAQISCVDSPILVAGVEKTCENHMDASGKPQIRCNLNRFINETSESNQYVLVHHEYAGLAGIETGTGADSDYTISNQLSGYLEVQEIRRLVVRSKPFDSIESVKAYDSAGLDKLFSFNIDRNIVFDPAECGDASVSCSTDKNGRHFRDLAFKNGSPMNSDDFAGGKGIEPGDVACSITLIASSQDAAKTLRLRAGSQLQLYSYHQESITGTNGNTYWYQWFHFFAQGSQTKGRPIADNDVMGIVCKKGGKSFLNEDDIARGFGGLISAKIE